MSKLQSIATEFERLSCLKESGRGIKFQSDKGVQFGDELKVSSSKRIRTRGSNVWGKKMYISKHIEK